jgi:hypothetical protein
VKNRKVSLVRSHVGIQLAGLVSTSVSVKQHKAELELTPVGVHVIHKNNKGLVKDLLIPFPNIQLIEFFPEEPEKKA